MATRWPCLINLTPPGPCEKLQRRRVWVADSIWMSFVFSSVCSDRLMLLLHTKHVGLTLFSYKHSDSCVVNMVLDMSVCLLSIVLDMLRLQLLV